MAIIILLSLMALTPLLLAIYLKRHKHETAEALDNVSVAWQPIKDEIVSKLEPIASTLNRLVKRL